MLRATPPEPRRGTLHYGGATTGRPVPRRRVTFCRRRNLPFLLPPIDSARRNNSILRNQEAGAAPRRLFNLVDWLY